jgi:diacylglycerol kinase (ATP)
MQVTLIHNSSSGDGEGPDADELKSLIRNAGHELLYADKKKKGWKKALKEETDLVVVAGGDGTIGSVAKKLIGRHVPMAPLPMGTANNIARTLGLEDRTIEELVNGWDLSHRLVYDAGAASGPWGNKWFIEGFGVGLFACAIPVADNDDHFEELDTAKEKVDYARDLLTRALSRHPPHHVKIRLDDEDLSDDYALVEVMNMEFIGPNLHLAPDIRPSDGLFDVVLVRSSEKKRLIDHLARHSGSGKVDDDLTRIRCRKVEIEWDGFQVHLDDEAWPAEDEKPKKKKGKIVLKVVRDALIFLHPGMGSK